MKLHTNPRLSFHTVSGGNQVSLGNEATDLDEDWHSPVIEIFWECYVLFLRGCQQVICYDGEFEGRVCIRMYLP